MRAKFINEKFSEEGDPIEDMGIGTLEVKLDRAFLRKMSLEELQEIYNRIHGNNHGLNDSANLIVDDVHYDATSYTTKIRLNNLVVDVMRYKKNLIKRDEVRSKAFKPGDAIKCKIRDTWWIGYPIFSKRGIIKTDSYGRIVARTLKGEMKVPLNYAIKLTPKEQRAFDKEYFFVTNEKLQRRLEAYRNWNPARYKKTLREYEEFLNIFKNKKIKPD